MSLQESIANFVIAHSSLLKKVEQMAVNELISVVKQMYPNDAVLQAIVEKVSQEILKLQGIDISQ